MNLSQKAFLATLDFWLPADFQQALFAAGQSPLLEQEDGTTIYGIAELAQFNADYEASELYPGLYLIGTNGGSEAYAIEKSTGYFVMTPLIGHDEETPIVIGRTWAEFVRRLRNDDLFAA